MNMSFSIVSNLQTLYHFKLISKTWTNIQEASGYSTAPKNHKDNQ